MLKIKFNKSATMIDADFLVISNHVIQLLGDDVPSTSTGFNVYKEDGTTLLGEFPNYKTTYRTVSGGYQFSDDKSVWIGTITFKAKYGELDGDLKQQAEKYEDIVVPTPKESDIYYFVEWDPEVPTTGAITEDATYTAIFAEKPYVIFNSDGGMLEGNTFQRATDYSQLVIPTPIDDDDYTFKNWDPEIPTSGAITENQTFTAKFEAHVQPTIKERVATLETTQEIQDEAITDLAELIDETNSANEVEDEAITDLGNLVG